MLKQRKDLTFKHNLTAGRHGWLRLTPAYSIKVVHDILHEHPDIAHVLDPFSGTGTTGLVCAERGLACDLIDINPFLVWLANIKTTNYDSAELQRAKDGARRIAQNALRPEGKEALWFPPISNIERWWDEDKRNLLAKLRAAIEKELGEHSPAKNLLLIAFSRLVIEWSNAAFNHQSVSFKEKHPPLFRDDEETLCQRFLHVVDEVLVSAAQPLSGKVHVINADSRKIPQPTSSYYDAVISSPPYPNRMSYIRELRPYMYWLGYLNEAREAAELDWQAIGGTWGAATSWLMKWKPDGTNVNDADFTRMIEKIKQSSPLLANYVHRYFVDISLHITSVYANLKSGGLVFYIVGNSKFYDTLVPVEKIYATLLRQNGFANVDIEILRKRNSKKELIEFIVSGQKL